MQNKLFYFFCLLCSLNSLLNKLSSFIFLTELHYITTNTCSTLKNDSLDSCQVGKELQYEQVWIHFYCFILYLGLFEPNFKKKVLLILFYTWLQYGWKINEATTKKQLNDLKVWEKESLMLTRL